MLLENFSRRAGVSMQKQQLSVSTSRCTSHRLLDASRVATFRVDAQTGNRRRCVECAVRSILRARRQGGFLRRV